MEEVARFRVADVQREPVPRVNLRDDAGVTITLEAVTLLAQYRTASDDVLMILDENCPYEEQLHLVAVRGSEVIDHLVIRAPYATGSFEALGTGEDGLLFRFAGGDMYRASVAEAGARLPRPLPGGARRTSKWFARKFLHLTIEEARS